MKAVSLVGAFILTLQVVNALHPLSELRHRYDNVAGAHDVVRVNKKGKGAKDFIGRENLRKQKVRHYHQRKKNQNIRMHKV